MWSTLEVFCHLADSEALFADRMKRVLAEERPMLPFADPDRYAAALAYQEFFIGEMMQIRLDTAYDLDVNAVGHQLNAHLGGEFVIGDPFDRHIEKMRACTESLDASLRGKRSIISSAIRLGRRFGPGKELSFRIGRVSAKALVTKRWFCITTEESLPPSDVDLVTELWTSVAEGSLRIFE
jgi:hypothetical protein